MQEEVKDASRRNMQKCIIKKKKNHLHGEGLSVKWHWTCIGCSLKKEISLKNLVNCHDHRRNEKIHYSISNVNIH